MKNDANWYIRNWEQPFLPLSRYQFGCAIKCECVFLFGNDRYREREREKREKRKNESKRKHRVNKLIICGWWKNENNISFLWNGKFVCLFAWVNNTVVYMYVCMYMQTVWCTFFCCCCAADLCWRQNPKQKRKKNYNQIKNKNRISKIRTKSSGQLKIVVLKNEHQHEKWIVRNESVAAWCFLLTNLMYLAIIIIRVSFFLV